MLNPEKLDMNILQSCPPHLSDVANLPWEFQEYDTIRDAILTCARKPT